MLCKIAKIDRSNFYKWFKNPHINAYEGYDNTLKNIFNMSNKTYGYRRMHLAMKKLGFKQNEKIVRKRMKILDLKCEIRQNKRKNMAKKEVTYAEAMGEIEKILARLRNEEMDVDSLAAEVKRATELIASCKARLRKAEADVNKILE